MLRLVMSGVCKPAKQTISFDRETALRNITIHPDPK